MSSTAAAQDELEYWEGVHKRASRDYNRLVAKGGWSDEDCAMVDAIEARITEAEFWIKVHKDELRLMSEGGK